MLSINSLRSELPMSDDGNPRRRTVLKTIGAGVGASALAGAGAMGSDSSDVTQEEVSISVSLTPGGSEDYEIAGTLTLPPEGQRKPVVQLLIHGITYARYYNDFPYEPDKYSYVQHAADAGYPTLNIDRIGIGESSHPPAQLVTMDTNSHTIHQIVQKLRAGEISDESFDEVMLVGHSYGSMISATVQARYQDADYVILTGFSQSYGQGAPFTAPFRSGLYPAQTDDKWDTHDRPPGYLTTRPGYRRRFYYEPGTEDRVIEIDEQEKQTVTDMEFATIPSEFPSSLEVDEPVLLINGDQDAYFCGVQNCSDDTGVSLTEDTLWPNADFTFEVTPGVGHDIYLHKRGDEAIATMLDWADEQIN